MQFNKIDAETIEVSENGIIGYITTFYDSNVTLFEFKAGVNPSLTLGEMKEILAYMEKL